MPLYITDKISQSIFCRYGDALEHEKAAAEHIIGKGMHRSMRCVDYTETLAFKDTFALKRALKAFEFSLLSKYLQLTYAPCDKQGFFLQASCGHAKLVEFTDVWTAALIFALGVLTIMMSKHEHAKLCTMLPCRHMHDINIHIFVVRMQEIQLQLAMT